MSIAHAEATLEAFESEVPTPSEIRDSAHTQKQKLYPEPDQVEQWKRELIAEQGDVTPRPFVPEPLPKRRADDLPPQGSPEMFKLVAKRLGLGVPNATKWGKVSWGQIYAAMRELGYRLNSDQEALLTDAVLPPPPPENVITEADVEAALRELERRRESKS
jgi:hypothetical protein